jgi:hypothetical protein
MTKALTSGAHNVGLTVPELMREGSATHHFICAMPGGIRIEFATPFA